MLVKFSENMLIVPDLAMITNGTVEIDDGRVPVFDIEIIPSDDSNPENLKFDWNVTSMT